MRSPLRESISSFPIGKYTHSLLFICFRWISVRRNLFRIIHNIYLHLCMPTSPIVSIYRWSCTYPAARFVTSFFVALVIGDDRHHILNNSYVIRKKDGSSESTPIVSKEQLLAILDSIFGLRGFASTDDLDRYL